MKPARFFAVGVTAAFCACSDSPVTVPVAPPTVTAGALATAAPLAMGTPLPALTYTVEELLPATPVDRFGGATLIGDGGHVLIRVAAGDHRFWDGTTTPLAGGATGTPFEVADDGRIVGWSFATGALEPAVWIGGALSILPGGPGAAFDVSASGTVIGANPSTAGDLMVWSGASFQQYSVPGFDLLQPRYVNAGGQVLMTGISTDPISGGLRRDALIWTPASVVAIPPVCTNMSVAASLGSERLNDAGQAIGSCSSGSRQWYFDGATALVVPTLGGSRTSLFQINAAGRAVGYSQDATGAQRAVAFHPSVGFTDYGLMGGDDTWASAINDADVVIGRIETAGRYQAWATEVGVPRLLPTLGGAESFANDINEAGVIVGTAEDASGAYRAVAWRPASASAIVANMQAALTSLTAAGAVAPGPARAMSQTLRSGSLRGFIRQVQGLVTGGVVPPDVGAAFIDAARTALTG